MAKKSIWEHSLTIHPTIKEKMNAVLLQLARDKKVSKARIMEILIETHPEYERKKEIMEKEDFFL